MSYTSQVSFLDLDEIPVYNPDREEDPKFSGKRIKRGLYRAKGGRLINADVQGSYNITRKVAPRAYEGAEDFAVHPVRIALAKQTKKRAK